MLNSEQTSGTRIDAEEGDLSAFSALGLQGRCKPRTAADMAASLVDLFGTGAKAIVLSQRLDRDVGRESGVIWQELLPHVLSEIAQRGL